MKKNLKFIQEYIFRLVTNIGSKKKNHSELQKADYLCKYGFHRTIDPILKSAKTRINLRILHNIFQCDARPVLSIY